MVQIKRRCFKLAKSKWESVRKKLEQVEIWASMGLSEKQIAHNLGISKSTMENYKNAHLDFLDSLKRGKEVADSKVENSLYKKATGYRYREQQAIKVKESHYDDKGKKVEKEKVVIVEVEKEVQPETAAMKFWLVNRQKARWKDNPHKVKNDNEMLKLKKEEVRSKIIPM